MRFKGRNGILDVNKTTEAVIGAAIEVHCYLDPGLLESTNVTVLKNGIKRLFFKLKE